MDLSQIDWYAVLPALGVKDRYLSKKHGPCPFCDANPQPTKVVIKGKEKRKRANVDRFRFDNKRGMGTWFCSHCGAGNGFSFIRKFTGWSDHEIFSKLEALTGLKSSDTGPINPIRVDEEISPEEAAENRVRLAAAWRKAKRISVRDPVAQYLRRRVPGCTLSRLSTEIRFNPSMKYVEFDENDNLVSKGFHPVMLARAVDSSLTPITLHRTYLTKDGSKAPVEQPKKQMKGVRKLRGAAIRMVQVPGSRVLGVCEGIETGLAIATRYRYEINVWALLNAGNLAVADIPDGMFDKVIIFADHDYIDPKHGYRPGEHYARKLEARLKERGIPCEVKIPPQEGTDFADLWVAYYATLMDNRQRMQKARAHEVASRLNQPAPGLLETTTARIERTAPLRRLPGVRTTSPQAA